MRSLAGFVVGVLLTVLLGLAGWGLIASLDRSRSYAPIASRTATPLPSATRVDSRVWIDQATWISGTVQIRFIAKQIPGDLTFEPPLLSIGDKTYNPTAASLKKARFDLLDSITSGQATAQLDFERIADWQTSFSGALIFNPSAELNNVVSPRIVVMVSWHPLTPTPAMTLTPAR
jgi:hypothetical protein